MHFYISVSYKDSICKTKLENIFLKLTCDKVTENLEKIINVIWLFFDLISKVIIHILLKYLHYFVSQ